MAITLRFLGGASFYDVCDIFDVDKATFYYIKDEVIIAINKAFNFKFDITDESQIKDLMAGFRRKSAPGLIDRCFGCLDGWAPVLQRPSKKKVKNRHRLYLRKQYYTISVQAICCPKGYFLWYDMRCTGNTHDSTTFMLSPLYKLLAASELLRRLGAYLVGDAAYTAEWFLLTPYKGKSLLSTFTSRR